MSDASSKPNVGKVGLYANMRAMVLLQFVSYLMPLMLVPYLTRTLGASLFGVVAFGLAISQVAAVITDYGFGLSATYAMSKKGSQLFASRMLGAVTASKVVLGVVTCTTVFILGLTQSTFRDHSAFFGVLMVAIVAQSLSFAWFFQGIEKLRLYTKLAVASRVVHFALTLLLVRDAATYHLTAVALVVSTTLLVIASFVAFTRLGYKLKWPGVRFARVAFACSTPYFWSRASVVLYSGAGSVLLGALSTTTQVAYYAAAEQVYRAVQGIVGMASQALYPYMVRTRDFDLLYRLFKVGLVASVIASCCAIFCGGGLATYLYGASFESVAPAMTIFMVAAAIVVPSVLLGYPLLGAHRQLHLANKSVMYAGAIQLLALGVVVAFGTVTAFEVALAVLVAESFVLTIRIIWAGNLGSFRAIARAR